MIGSVTADATVQLLRDLVAIDSVNPGLVPGSVGEGPAGDRVAQACRQAGMDVERQEVAPGRSNVVAAVEAATPGPTLLFCGHLDTVGVEGMRDPFDPVLRDGRVHGRGSQDMKSGVAAMVGAAAALVGRLPAGRLVVAAVVDEEHLSAGAEALVTRWTADAVVVTEPTGLRMATTHKGFAWVEVETHGRAAHGSRPEEGRDAVMMMGRVLGALEAQGRRLQARSPRPLVGTPSLHASTIQGGREPSVYPDHCRLTIERRSVAGEPEATALREVQAVLDDLGRADPDFAASARLLVERPPHEVPLGDRLVTTLQAELVRRGLEVEPTGVSYWTDAAVLARARIPTVLFGPTGAGLHSVEEWVDVESVLTCQAVLVGLARAYLEGVP